MYLPKLAVNSLEARDLICLIKLYNRNDLTITMFTYILMHLKIRSSSDLECMYKILKWIRIIQLVIYPFISISNLHIYVKRKLLPTHKVPFSADLTFIEIKFDKPVIQQTS